MPNIIDTSFFYGNLEIAQIANAEVSNTVGMYIKQYEPRYLELLLGYPFYNASPDLTTYPLLLNGHEYTNVNGELTKWQGLKWADGTLKKSPIANYIYFHYMRDHGFTHTTGTGEKTAKNQNADNASPWPKMCRAWNEMVMFNKYFYSYVLSNVATYPLYVDIKTYRDKERRDLFKLCNPIL